MINSLLNNDSLKKMAVSLTAGMTAAMFFADKMVQAGDVKKANEMLERWDECLEQQRFMIQTLHGANALKEFNRVVDEEVKEWRTLMRLS